MTGNTWEGPLPSPPLAVLSAALQNDGILIVTAIVLNGPAPTGGVAVNVSLTREGVPIGGSPTQLTVPAGQTAAPAFAFGVAAGRLSSLPRYRERRPFRSITILELYWRFSVGLPFGSV